MNASFGLVGSLSPTSVESADVAVKMPVLPRLPASEMVSPV
ncbi:MAG TPA: hypothetical protein VNS22_12490 [Geminicoccus sp.]|nr:hypothetical protein [Geminicoccus sp.]HWL69190.1 hypothetical protein [Geminicoccus sp.]